MTQMFDQQYLLSSQYNDSARLNARIQLHELYSTNPIAWQRWVFDQITIAAPYRVLELGCGPGQLWLKNLKRIPADWQITLSDFSAGMLADTQRNLGTERFQYVEIDAQSIPFPDASFEVVIANHMLYHVPDRARAIAEMRRVLAPTGHFYAATNGVNHLAEIKQLCQRAGIALKGVLGAPADVHFRVQNGAEQLAASFSHVELRMMENNQLAVTEAGPLLAYVLSCFPPDSISEDQLNTLATIIQQELDQHGVIQISKETGLFIAS
ncbi:hypothetical protein KDA_41160 [Dictyobacter alpinus]|uniref:Methyltransferase type 11 domain-containing protein n=1 Tax=Dictyobacter alpinus TaxID=2014873 RepID=A0A402BBF7_9CHLR|nr:class I SAM-dependent methyltransferase [Dictyobacter alpinus]GCE28632.1 hypothetical protein KDA_41160 [Dictyobacter alpinus]